LAGKRVASKLRIPENDPILIRRRFVYDIKGVPVEYNIGYYRADSFTYTITAER
jgi:GntR family transcriptional regulator